MLQTLSVSMHADSLQHVLFHCSLAASQHSLAHPNPTSKVMFLDALDPRVGHTMDVLSPFISVLCHSD